MRLLFARDIIDIREVKDSFQDIIFQDFYVSRYKRFLSIRAMVQYLNENVKQFRGEIAFFF